MTGSENITDLDCIGTNVEAADDGNKKRLNFIKVISADAPRLIHQHHKVNFGRFTANTWNTAKDYGIQEKTK